MWLEYIGRYVGRKPTHVGKEGWWRWKL